MIYHYFIYLHNMKINEVKKTFFDIDYTLEKKRYFESFGRKPRSIIDYGGGDGKLLKVIEAEDKIVISTT